MREIEFRAKRDKEYCKTQDWTYGVPFIAFDGDCIFKTDCSEWVVMPETVGQYTGLKDKNGTKIFEGDIIHTYHGNGKIVYSQQYALFGYIMIEKDNTEKEYDYRFTDVVIEDGIEVIGNIYDNPELLEGE